MSGKSGYIVEFRDTEGVLKTGHAYHKSQPVPLRLADKVVINEVEGRASSHVKKNGREVVYIRAKSDIKVVGFLS